jgi:ribonuclease P protein component
MPSLTPHRLRKHADYQLVYKAGRKQFSKQIAYFHALRPADRRSDTPGVRIGLTVPKALGKAVDRNRIKRRMREAVRAALPLLNAPVDVILHPRRSVIELEFLQLKREVAQIFRSVQAACDRSAALPKPSNSLPTHTNAAKTAATTAA